MLDPGSETVEQRTYTIGELSDISGISKSALRLYDEKGLLQPEERDEENNYRLYSEQQIIDALMIREMKQRGFSMTEIKDGLVRKRDELTAELDSIQNQLSYLDRTIGTIEGALDYYDGEQGEYQPMVIDTMPEMTVIFDRKNSYINANHLFWDRYNDIHLLKDQEHVTVNGPFSAIFYDHYLNQFFFDEGDLEIYLPIEEADAEGPHIRTIGGFLRASMVAVGWYSELLGTYVELVKQIMHEGYKIVGPAYEEYLVEFSYGITKDQCVTRVSFPIEKIEN